MKRVICCFAFVGLGMLAKSAGQEPLPRCQKLAAMVQQNMLADGSFKTILPTLTAISEMELASKMARCVSDFPDKLSAADYKALDVASYVFAVDVATRMYDFINRHHLANAFYEEESKRVE